MQVWRRQFAFVEKKYDQTNLEICIMEYVKTLPDLAIYVLFCPKYGN